jgi:hypothetical protein
MAAPADPAPSQSWRNGGEMSTEKAAIRHLNQAEDGALARKVMYPLPEAPLLRLLAAVRTG